MENRHGNPLKSASKEILKLKAFWEPAGDAHAEHKSVSFQQRKAFCRNSGPPTTQIESSRKVIHSGQSVLQSLPGRPKSTPGFGDYFDSTEGSKKARVSFITASQQDLKRRLLSGQDISHRHCVSSLAHDARDEKRIESRAYVEAEKSDELDFSEKVKAFRALFKAKRGTGTSDVRNHINDVSNEQLRRGKGLGDVQDGGNHVRFTARSRRYNYSESLGDVMGERPLEEQREICVEKNGSVRQTEASFRDSGERDWSEPRNSSREEVSRVYADSEDPSHVTLLAEIREINNSSDLRMLGKQSKGMSLLRSSQADEFQLTYEEDMCRRTIGGNTEVQRKPPPPIGPGNGNKNSFSENSEVEKLGTSDHFPRGQTGSRSKSLNHIIKRQHINNSDGLRLTSDPADAIGHILYDTQTREYSRANYGPRGDKNSTDLNLSNTSKIPIDYFKKPEEILETNLEQKRNEKLDSYPDKKYSPSVKQSSSANSYTEQFEINRGISLRSPMRPNSVVLPSATGEQEVRVLPERSQSATPTSGRMNKQVNLFSERSGEGVPHPGASLRAHLNYLGASLSSLSSKLNSDLGSEKSSVPSSGGRKRITGDLNNATFNIVTRTQSYKSRKDGSPVREAIQNVNNQPLQKSSLDSQVQANYDRHRSLHCTRSESSDRDFDTCSKQSSCVSTRQTNVPGFGNDENIFVYETKSSSSSGTKPSAFARHKETSSGANKAPVTTDEFYSTVKRKQELRKMIQFIHRNQERANSAPRLSSHSRNSSTEHSTDGESSSSDESEIDSQFQPSNDGKRPINLKHVKPQYGLEVKPRWTNENKNVIKVITRNKPVRDTRTLEAKCSTPEEDIPRKISNSYPRDSPSNKEMSNRVTTSVRKGFVKELVDHLKNKRQEKAGEDLIRRSRSAIDFVQRSKDNLRDSLPPSKRNDIKDSSRPQSAIDWQNLKPIQGRRKTHLKGKRELRLEKFHVDGPRQSPLLRQVENLHKEVDERLASKENVAHYVRSVELSGLCADESDELGDLSDASTITNCDSDAGDDEVRSGSNAKVKKPGPSFLTSTPLKEVNRVQMDEERKHDKRITFTKSGHAVKRPATREKTHSKQLITNGGDANVHHVSDIPGYGLKTMPRKMLTPDYTHRLSVKEAGAVDEDADEDDLETTTPLPRPGSVGAQTIARRDDADIVSRILKKMSSGPLTESLLPPPSPTRGTAYLNGHVKLHRNMFTPMGRASPAESLLNHVDNPTMVRLLQMLYKADPATRQIIMVKVQYFKAWHQHVVLSREHRLKKTALSKMSVAFRISRLLLGHFLCWQQRSAYNMKMRRASAMFRAHMLTKGFKALQWSVRQSRHQTEKLQAKLHSIMLKGTFFKWRTKSETQRRERLENAVKRWKQFVSETHKIRHMREVTERNLLVDVVRRWKKLYNKQRKHNLAFYYFRKTLLKHVIVNWMNYVKDCKAKKETHATALTRYQTTLVRMTFKTMKVVFSKSQKAKSHFRYHTLKEVFQEWKAVSQIFKDERTADELSSLQHWERKKMQQTLFHWCEQIKLRRAERKANFKMCRKSFTTWLHIWRHNLTHRQDIEHALLRKKLHRALLTWRRNVVILQQRQTLAVSLIESCHLRQTLKTWRMYTASRVLLKKTANTHLKASQHRTLSTCFYKWKSSFQRRQEAENVKRIISENCARNYAARWREICHKRSLVRLFENTQPQREHQLCRVYFSVWLSSLLKQHKENEKAEEKRKSLEQQDLRRKFVYWLMETKRRLKIKPIVQRREKESLTEVFSSWKSFVMHKKKCKQNKAAFQQKILQKIFVSWKRQLSVCQIAKEIGNRISQGLLLALLEGWKFVIMRKRASRGFRNNHLLNTMFFTWKNRASSLYTHRVRMEEERENNMELKKWSFTQWRQNVQSQKSWVDHSIEKLIDRHNGSELVRFFTTWRRQLHSTLIARAYNKTQTYRFLATIFSAWHEVTDHAVSDAVQMFSERIGLVNANTQDCRSHIVSFYAESNGNEHETSDRGLTGNFSTPSIVLDNGRLVSDGEVNLDTDRYNLINGGLIASIEDHQAKCLRLKEMVTKAVIRLMHWPICVVFEQWKELTARGTQLKAASAQLAALHTRTITTLTFKEWKNYHHSMIKAQKFRNMCTLTRCMQALQSYKDDRKYVKQLSQRAHQHCMMVAFHKYFPAWHHKTQELCHEKQILHLWISRTPREIELYPLEKMMSQKLSQRTLLLCFSLWLIQYRAVAKIRNVYHGSLLKWIYSAWGEWAREKHIVILKSQEFLNQRRIKLAFRKWCQRFSQSTETERLYQQAWNNYLLIILQQWGIWAKTSHELHSLQQVFQQQQSRHALQSSFTFWQSLTVKVKSIRSNAMHKLLYSIFRDWRHAVREIRNRKHKVLHFQVQSYTLLVKRLYFQWHEAYKKRQQLTEERRVHIEQIALNFAGIWRRKAQKRRGEMLRIMFEKRKTKHCFQHWRASLSHIQFLYNQLDDWSSKKNVHMLKVCLRSWQTQLVANQARKLYMSRLLHAMLAEWRVFAKVNRERRIRGLALKKALQERSLHVYFQYWVAVTKVKLSVQQNVELKLQIRVFRAWRHYSHKLHHLRELQALMTKNVCTRIMHNAFQNIRWRAEYCTSLYDMAERIVKDKELATMRAVIVMWKERINKLVSVRCYKHMLTIRVVKQWHRFVHKKCLDRKQDNDNWEKAVNFYNKILCKSAFSAMKLEVSVHHMVEKRSQRLCNKYAKMWKNKVDLCVTAIFLEQEFVQKRVWAKWRREYIKAYSTQKIVEQYEKQTLSQIFKAWRKLAVSIRSKQLQLQQTKPGQASQVPVDNQRDTRVSMLPVPLTQSRQSPVSISSPVGKSGPKTNNNH